MTQIKRATATLRKNGSTIRVQSFDTDMEMRQYASGMLDAIIQSGVRTVQDAVKQAWTWTIWGDTFNLELSKARGIPEGEELVKVWKVEWSAGWWAVILYVGADTQVDAVKCAKGHPYACKNSPSVQSTPFLAREYGVLSVDEFEN